MAVSAVLRASAVTVAPGGSGRCHVLIRNRSAVVDQFVFSVMGDASEWTEVKPARVNLMPNQEVSVELTFSPPRTHDVLAGDHPFALKVASREDRAGSVVQEGIVTVTKFAEVAADIVPRTSEGRRRGRHTVAVDNLGNYTHLVEVLATDPDNKLTFVIRPRAPQTRPGTATFVKLKARPKKYFWKGADRLLPFAVRLLAPGLDPIQLDGTLRQRPLLPRRLLWLLSALLALAILATFILTVLLRQRPISMAGPAPTAPLSVSRSTPSTPVSAGPPVSATSPAPSPRPPVGSGGGNGDQQPAGTITFTVAAAAFPGAGGGPQLFSYVVPDGQNYRVTSALLRNPDGDTGALQIWQNDRVLANFELAAIHAQRDNQITYRFPQPPTLRSGELMTLAVTCGNPENPCHPTGRFSATLVR